MRSANRNAMRAVVLACGTPSDTSGLADVQIPRQVTCQGLLIHVTYLDRIAACAEIDVTMIIGRTADTPVGDRKPARARGRHTRGFRRASAGV